MPWSLNPQNEQPSGILRYESVVMLNTTEDRESQKLTRRRRRMLQFRIRIWNPMNCLGRARTIVIENIFGNDPADVINTEKDEVVQRFLTQCPIESLDVW